MKGFGHTLITPDQITIAEYYFKDCGSIVLKVFYQGNILFSEKHLTVNPVYTLFLWSE